MCAKEVRAHRRLLAVTRIGPIGAQLRIGERISAADPACLAFIEARGLLLGKLLLTVVDLFAIVPQYCAVVYRRPRSKEKKRTCRSNSSHIQTVPKWKGKSKKLGIAAKISHIRTRRAMWSSTSDIFGNEKEN